MNKSKPNTNERNKKKHIKGQPSDKWYRMDNSAVIYPMSTTPTSQSLFRMTVEMTGFIDEEFLLEAVKNTLPRYPTFAVQLRAGVFHHYLDHNSNEPIVVKDNGILFEKINFLKNKFYLFRVNYFQKKISVDFFHVLCDGTGAMEFVKSLIYQYIIASGNTLTEHGNIKVQTDPINPSELEDGFVKYYKGYNIFGGVVGKMTGKDAFPINGKRFAKIGCGLIEGYINTEALKVVAKKYNCTITVLLAAVVALSVTENYAKGYQKKMLDIMIPINLRNMFPSDTLKNFTSLAKCQINLNTTPRTLEAYTKAMKDLLATELTKEGLQDKISISSITEHSFFAKIVPLFIKAFIIRISRALSFNPKQTMIVSNMGNVVLPKEMGNHINSMSFNANVSRKTPCNMGIVSYNGTTAVAFTRQIVSTAIERSFFTKLAAEGIRGDQINVISNFREIKR